MTDNRQRTHWRHRFGHKLGWRPFQRSTNITIFTFHCPPATLPKPSSPFLSYSSWRRHLTDPSLARQSTSPIPGVEKMRQHPRGPPWCHQRSGLQPVYSSSLDYILSTYLILWHSKPNISTDIFSTFSAEAFVQCATSNVTSQMFWLYYSGVGNSSSPFWVGWKVPWIRDRRISHLPLL